MPYAKASAELASVAARLKVNGDRGLRLQLLRGLKAAAAPLIEDVNAAALAQLPSAGGLNQRVAGQRKTVSVRTGARTAGVRLTTRDLDTSETDQGYVRHPVYGNRRVWVQESLPRASGWWTKTLTRASTPRVTYELTKVMREVAAEINRV